MATRAPLDTARATRLFHALSDETRVGILEWLRGRERCVCELTDQLDLPQSLLSFHLKTLREAGLVTDRRQGRWVYYALATVGIAEALEALGELHVEPPPRAGGPRC